MIKTKSQRSARGSALNLLAFREEFGLTQEHLGLLLNISKSYVSLMERGKRDIRIIFLDKLAQYRDQIHKRIEVAGPTRQNLHVKYQSGWADLISQWSRRLRDIEYSIRQHEYQRSKQCTRYLQNARVHSRLSTFVHTMEDDATGTVLKLSHLIKSDQVGRSTQQKEVKEDLRLACWKAEEAILKQFIEIYGEVDENNLER